MSLRQFIDLIEAATASINPSVPVEGRLPAKQLASMLPDVQNVQMFGSALLKIEQGRNATLVLAEIRELARAFMSLVQLPDPQKMQVILKMNPVQQVTAAPPAPPTDAARGI